MALNRPAKSCLFEYCQKQKIGPPSFETWAAPGGYQAKVIIDGYHYEQSALHSKKKDAEHDAARICLSALGTFHGDHGGGKINQDEYIVGANVNRSISKPSLNSGCTSPGSKGFSFLPKSGGFSGNAKMPKSALHEYCQANHIALPRYNTEGVYNGHILQGFNCVLIVNDQYYTTDNLHPNKREAEHAVSHKALNIIESYERSVFYGGDSQSQKFKTPSQKTKFPTLRTPETLYKSLLQEHLQQRQIEIPSYSTEFTDGGYLSKVIIEGQSYVGKDCCSSKKQAEQSAAKAGLIAMGVKDPEAVARGLTNKNLQSGNKSMHDAPYKKDLRDLVPDDINVVKDDSSWLHYHNELRFDVDDFDDIDGEFADFQKVELGEMKRKLSDSMWGNERSSGAVVQRPSKIRCIGQESVSSHQTPSSGKRPLRSGEYEVKDVHLGNLSVAEAWPEKRNIVIVGSEETSIPLFCQGDRYRCSLKDISTGELVDILPGHRLVGLEGSYVVRGGQIVLRATQCKKILMPETPDDVLVSCGVVVLHCIPKKENSLVSCDVNILLKRYLCSQAFINVVRGLAQYFRCRESGRSFTFNKELMVSHVKDWMLEEVMAIASFSGTALENVFQHIMKFDRRWLKYFTDKELSPELRHIQTAANDELLRRANNGEDQNQDRFRPWKLPKGNLYHRVLTTGVFLESPAEAAMRELKEETGIKLKLSDIKSSPYVDLPQKDNINPHKGDFARYFLCGIITEEEKNTEKEVGKQESPNKDVNVSGTMRDNMNTPVVTCSSNQVQTPVITNSTYNEASSMNAQAYSANTALSHGYTGSRNVSVTPSSGCLNANFGNSATMFRDNSATYGHANTNYGNYSTGYDHVNTSYEHANSGYGNTNAGKNNETTGFSNPNTNYGISNTDYGSIKSGHDDLNIDHSNANIDYGKVKTSTTNATTYSESNHLGNNAGGTYGSMRNTGTYSGHCSTDQSSHEQTGNIVSRDSNSATTDVGEYSTNSEHHINAVSTPVVTHPNPSITSDDNSVSLTCQTTYSAANTEPGFTESTVTLSSSSCNISERKEETTENSSIVNDETKNENESTSDEGSNVIRSPFIAGAFHEECKWFDMYEAKEICTEFHEIHQSEVFQKLLARLKEVVTTM